MAKWTEKYQKYMRSAEHHQRQKITSNEHNYVGKENRAFVTSTSAGSQNNATFKSEGINMIQQRPSDGQPFIYNPLTGK